SSHCRRGRGARWGRSETQQKNQGCGAGWASPMQGGTLTPPKRKTRRTSCQHRVDMVETSRVSRATIELHGYYEARKSTSTQGRHARPPPLRTRSRLPKSPDTASDRAAALRLSAQPLEHRVVEVINQPALERDCQHFPEGEISRPHRLRDGGARLETLIGTEVDVGLNPHPAFHPPPRRFGCRTMPLELTTIRTGQSHRPQEDGALPIDARVHRHPDALARDVLSDRWQHEKRLAIVAQFDDGNG